MHCGTTWTRRLTATLWQQQAEAREAGYSIVVNLKELGPWLVAADQSAPEIEVTTCNLKRGIPIR